MCNGCETITREIYATGRLRVWESLPKYFGFEEQDVLKRREREMVSGIPLIINYVINIMLDGRNRTF